MLDLASLAHLCGLVVALSRAGRSDAKRCGGSVVVLCAGCGGRSLKVGLSAVTTADLGSFLMAKVPLLTLVSLHRGFVGSVKLRRRGPAAFAA